MIWQPLLKSVAELGPHGGHILSVTTGRLSDASPDSSGHQGQITELRLGSGLCFQPWRTVEKQPRRGLVASQMTGRDRQIPKVRQQGPDVRWAEASKETVSNQSPTPINLIKERPGLATS